MANNIKVSAGTDHIATVKVRSTNINTPVSATSVEAVYHADRAEEYAGRAQESANIAKEAEQNAIIAVENISTLTSDSLNSISNATTEAISQIDDASAPVFEHLDTVKFVSDNIGDVIYVSSNVDTILNKTLEIGNVTTTPAGTNASVLNVGTKYNPILDFTFPKGDQGVKGDDGGMGAEYDESTQTISFFQESGSKLYPRWGNVQGDINIQTDLQALLNIKANMADVPVKTSQLQNDSKYITQTEMLQAIASIPQFKMSILTSLPTTGEKMTLYMIPKDGTDKDIYNEYVWIEETNSFEFLGTTAVDLTNYATKNELSSAIGDIDSILDEINGEVV